MNIGVVCNPHIGVAQKLRDDFDIHAGRKELAGEGVPQRVNADVFYPRPFQNTIVRPVQVTGINRFARRVGKHVRK